jgi:hypothetical protein
MGVERIVFCRGEMGKGMERKEERKAKENRMTRRG